MSRGLYTLLVYMSSSPAYVEYTIPGQAEKIELYILVFSLVSGKQSVFVPTCAREEASHTDCLHGLKDPQHVKQIRVPAAALCTKLPSLHFSKDSLKLVSFTPPPRRRIRSNTRGNRF